MSILEFKIIACYESKLISRTYLWHIFVWSSIGLTIYQLLLYLNYYSWDLIALDSSIPFLGVYYFNLLQGFMLVYVAANFVKKHRERKAMEVLDSYPVDNTTLLFGSLWGVVRLFAGLYIGGMVVILLIHIIFLPVPFRWEYYLFYFVTLLIPTFVFILGIAFLVAHVVKHHFGMILILLSFMFVSYLYLSDVFYGLFDFWGRALPNSFSSATGHSNLLLYLLQRFSVLCLGIGCIFLTLRLLFRIPNDTRKIKRCSVMGTGCILVACILQVGNFYTLYEVKKVRDGYRQSYMAYHDRPYVRVVSHDIRYVPCEKGYSAWSKMKVRNETSGEIKQVLLFLNPALQITCLTCSEQPVAYTRDRQVVVLNYPLCAGEEVIFEMMYEGTIDEHICFLDIDEDSYNDTRNNCFLPHRFGRKSAFCGEQYTLLTPECLWYPVAVPPLDLIAPLMYMLDFTDYTLLVENKMEKTVLSQGKKEIRGKDVFFRSEQPLPGLSLCIGDYRSLEMEVDGISFSLHYLPRSQFMIDIYAGMKTMREVLENAVWGMENNMRGRYPFKRYALIEVPSSFITFGRWWKEGSSLTQPEMGFIPERAVTMSWKPPAAWRCETQRDNVAMFESAREFFMNYPIHERTHMYAQTRLFTGFMISERYPGLHGVMQILINLQGRDQFALSGSYDFILEEAACFFDRHPLCEAVNNPKLQINNFQDFLTYKVMDLQTWMSLREDWSRVENFLLGYMLKNKFRRYDFEELREAFIQEFDFDLTEVLDPWYNNSGVPVLMLKDVECVRWVTENRRAVLRLSFKVYNPSKVDGVIARISAPYGTGDPKPIIEPIIVKAGECKEIRGLFRYTSNQQLARGLSFNQPSSIVVKPYATVQVKENELSGFERNMYPVDPAEFGLSLSSIVVDNTDDGFHIVDSRGRTRKLAEMFQAKQKRYGRLEFGQTRWVEVLDDVYYGMMVQTALCKLGGVGKEKVEWRANIAKTGEYEIFAYIAPLQTDPMEGVGSLFILSGELYYTVYSDNKPTEVLVRPDMYKGGWISLGKYRFRGGEMASVSLDDRVGNFKEHPLVREYGLVENDGYVQVIMADAVKWVLLDESVADVVNASQQVVE